MTTLSRHLCSIISGRKPHCLLVYEYSDIKFDTATAYDSVESRYYAGVAWDMTAKSRGTLKLGYAEKDFDLDTIKDRDNFSMELQTQHNLTPKQALQLNTYRKYNESDVAGASSFLSSGIEASFLQKFTEKWSATLTASFERNEYSGVDRDDDIFGIGPAVRFEPKKWLIFDLGYFYYNNDSNLSTYDYETNQIFIRGSLSF